MQFIFDTREILSLKELTRQVKQKYIKFIMRYAENNITKAARLLGLKERTSIYRILFPERYKSK